MKTNIFILLFFMITISCKREKANIETKKLPELTKLRIDHVIYLVKDIDSTSKQLSKKGFTIKRGKLHQNGLLNAHIKFKNKSSIELMSVKGIAKDAISKKYKSLLNNGEGGVYIALSGISTLDMETILTKNKISYDKVEDELWNYITFSQLSSFSHFFFIDYKIEVSDTSEYYSHKNASVGISEVWLEGDSQVKSFLSDIGIKYSGLTNDNNQVKGKRFTTNSGELILIPKTNGKGRSRIKKVITEDKLGNRVSIINM